MKGKLCVKCGELKTLSEFNKSDKGVNGYYSYCKSCQKIYNHKYWLRPEVRARQKILQRKWRISIRLQAMQKIQDVKQPFCSRCGCSDFRLLEINHKNGGGSKEYKSNRSHYHPCRSIVSNKRKVDDLEILCRVCNSLHYLELKHGSLPYEIIWDGDARRVVRT